MARRIFRAGNSSVVSLSMDVLEAVGLGMGDMVHVIADSENSRIIITPSTVLEVRPDLLERVNRFIDNYQPALEAMAQEP